MGKDARRSGYGLFVWQGSALLVCSLLAAACQDAETLFSFEPEFIPQNAELCADPPCFPGCLSDAECDGDTVCQQLEADESGSCIFPCGEEGCEAGSTCHELVDEDAKEGGLKPRSHACLEDHLTYCMPCDVHADCEVGPTSAPLHMCLPLPLGAGSFCATACSETLACPEGSQCVATTTAEGTRQVCQPLDGVCACSDWAVAQEAQTTCYRSVQDARTCEGHRSCTPDGLSACDAPEPKAETCNDLDDDCDGFIDEPYGASGNVRMVDTLGERKAKGDECGVGACEGGQVVCDASGEGLRCSSDDEASAERCDGIDNNCDGAIDEAFDPGGEIGLYDVLGPSMLGLGDACGAGVCSGGQVVCAADGLGLQCSSWDRLRPELCDGLDNNCDGQIDNGMIAPLIENQTGVCQGAAQVCALDGSGWRDPNLNAAIPNYEPREGTCDGLDNDCDGTIDERFTQGGVVRFREGFGDNAVSLFLGEACGLGVCAGGEVVCGGDGRSLACSSHVDAQIEICDGIDNDCDGRIDEDLQAPENPNQAGACAGSEQVCQGALGWAPNYDSVLGFGAYETPDGNFADENCDGIDGTLELAVFVTSSGFDFSDDDKNLRCAIDRPCRTLAWAIKQAQALELPHVYVQAGNYLEFITLPQDLGIEIYGGYGAGWQRRPADVEGHLVQVLGGWDDQKELFATLISDGGDGVVADLHLLAPLALGHNAEGSGRSTYGVHLKDSQLNLVRTTIKLGRGGDGARGSDGVDTPGTAPGGSKGGDAVRNASVCNSGSRGRGGAAASNPLCGAWAGGGGGRGGTRDTSCGFWPDWDARAGLGGGGGGGGAYGGGGGGGGGRCRAGGAGQNGGTVHGRGGGEGPSGGALSLDGHWMPYAGLSGFLGEHGSGGGGGGGSGGCDRGTDSYGAGGGGGGAGGCRAELGGSGGLGGGASIGILAQESVLSLSQVRFVGGQGGQGGQGGRGGRGQTPGPGGQGGKRSSNAGAGGSGGSGGSGGHSGGGGGGSGGWLIQILTQATALEGENTLGVDGEAGQMGFGGDAAAEGGAKGEPGAAGEHVFWLQVLENGELVAKDAL